MGKLTPVCNTVVDLLLVQLVPFLGGELNPHYFIGRLELSLPLNAVSIPATLFRLQFTCS